MSNLLNRWVWLAPAAFVGLYAGRVTSELLRPGLIGAILITLLSIALACWLLRTVSIFRSAPLSLLLLYILYPEPDPRVATMAGVLCLLTIGFLFFPDRRSRPEAGKFSLPYEAKTRLSPPLAVAILVGIFFLALYITTLAPDVLPADSGEFQLVAAELGVAHPPGFPLYIMLAHLATRLPLSGSPAYKVNLVSALFASFTLVMVYLSAYRLTGRIFAGLAAALVLGSSTTFWSQATTANIRSLTVLFVALAFYFLTALWASRVTQSTPFKTGQKRKSKQTPLFLFMLTIGLGITHHPSLVFLGLVGVLFLLLLDSRLFRQWWNWVIFGFLGLFALLPLLYLPLRSAAGALGAPDDLTSLSGFLNHALALGFRGDLFYYGEPAVLWQRLKIMGEILVFQFDPLLLVVMAAGMILAFRRDRRLGILLAGAFMVHTFITATYRAPQTVEYLLPATIPAVLALGVALGELSAIVAGRSDGADITLTQRTLSALVIAAVLVIAGRQAVDRAASYTLLSSDTSAREYAQPLLEQAPPDSVILADWHWVTPMWYLQVVEGQRPDISIQFVYPTSEPYADTWARRIAEELGRGRSVISTHFDEAAFTALPLPQPLEEAFLFSQEPLLKLPGGFQSLEATLEDQIAVLGYQLSKEAVEEGGEALLNLAWRSLSDDLPPLSLYAHLIGQDGQLYAQEDLPARAQPEGLTISQFRLTPRPGAAGRRFEIRIGAYGPDFSDAVALTGVSISGPEVTPASRPPFTQNPSWRPVVNNEDAKRLVGYDWDNTLPAMNRLYLHWSATSGYTSEVMDLDGGTYTMPAWVGPWGLQRTGTALRNDGKSHYVPLGQSLVWLDRLLAGDQALIPEEEIELNQYLAAGRPVLRNLIISVRLVGYEEDGHSWAWWDLDDSVPAMGAIPTLKWIGGSLVRSPDWPRVSPAAWPGQVVEPLVQLYDAFTNRLLPLLDERITRSTQAIPLGTGVVEE